MPFKLRNNKLLISLAIVYILSINFINNTVNTLEYLVILITINTIYKINIYNQNKEKGNKNKLKERIITSLIYIVIIVFSAINQNRIQYLGLLSLMIILEYYFNYAIPKSKYKMQLSWKDKIIITILTTITLYILTRNILVTIIASIILFIFIIGSTKERE